jgi:hypothetical protein
MKKLKIKDILKIKVFPNLILLLHKLGFSYKKLGNISFFNKSLMLAQSNKLGDFEVDHVDNKQNIYILEMLSGSTFHLYTEALMALGLKKKGHQITFIIDDGALPIHELKRVENEINWEYDAYKDYIFAANFLTRLKLDFIPISKFIQDKKNIDYNDKYNSILEASLLKKYKVGVLSENLPFLKKITTEIQKAIAITHYIGDKLVEIKPDSVIMSHGIYSTWGPPFQVLNDNNIPTLVHGRGKKRHSQVFNWNKTGDSWDVSEEWQRVKNKDLTGSELKEIKDYLGSRISHKDDVFVYNFGQETSKNETIKFLGLDKGKPIYTLFTNVLWDAASAQREIAFKNPVEWVIETIQWFNDHPEKQLIVKIHPAEVVIGTNMPFYDIILSRITPNKNIRIIKPDEKVNSWSIYEISDLGIVHTTTAGMEMPIVNKACVVVSKTHYRNKGFTLDVNSKEEYFGLLENFEESTIDFEKNKKEAIKYAYLLFIRYQIPFNMFYEDVSTHIIGYRYDTIERYFEDRFYSKIIDKIIQKETFFK